MTLSYTMGTTLFGLLAVESSSWFQFTKDVGIPGAILFFILGTTAYVVKKIVDLVGKKFLDWLELQIILGNTLKDYVEQEQSLFPDDRKVVAELVQDVKDIKHHLITQQIKQDIIDS